MSIPVRFVYSTGMKKDLFQNARLRGSWDRNGRYTEQWTENTMEPGVLENGSIYFTATVALNEAEAGREFRWGVIFDAPQGTNQWGILTEINSTASTDRYRTFVLEKGGTDRPQEEIYHLTHIRWLGANKQNATGRGEAGTAGRRGPNVTTDRGAAGIAGRNEPGLRFGVWAPNAEKVDVVFGGESGYIADDGFGVNESSDFSPLSMIRLKNGVWMTEIIPRFSRYDHRPYMYRIWKEGRNTSSEGEASYRTDLYSRCQIGSGSYDPRGGHFTGKITDLDGTKSCSVVIDPETVAKNFKEDVWPEHEFIQEEEFWKDEFTEGKSLPGRVEDLVIYELHIGALGFGKNRPGNFEDAIELLDYLNDLGVNAIELLPISEFEGWAQWGYGTSHYFALEYSAGGRDQFKHFIRACHRRGIAVIMDVVYNHYHHDAERAEWAYDSDVPEHNMYYWYEGRPSDYPRFIEAVPDGQKEHGGYIDNMSTGYAPRYSEEMVRKMFISSIATLVENFHIDGFRMDQTTSIHAYNVLHANGRPAGNVNIFGAKFLRELCSTLKMIKPNVILTAEDHSNWDKVAEQTDKGGLGFDAVWYADFYHHLSGDTGRGPEYANLLTTAGNGDDRPLSMDYFAGALLASASKKVVYNESHDEAGNSPHSMRTIRAAVNGAALSGENRRVAEARCRFAAGMSMLSAGTPLFLMGEEVGAQKDYKYSDFIDNREDLYGQRGRDGRFLFRFYQELIHFRLNNPGSRSHNIEILHVHNANRVLVFRRWDDHQEFIIAASLNNHPFTGGYVIENQRIANGRWQEVFNSDAEDYGGNNSGNYGMDMLSSNGRISVVIPANGFVVLERK
jgi:1,4-alpha-glucan branching enzyme